MEKRTERKEIIAQVSNTMRFPSKTRERNQNISFKKD